MLIYLVVIIVCVGKDLGLVLMGKYVEVRVYFCYSFILFFFLDNVMVVNEVRGEREFCIFLSNNVNLINNLIVWEI